jgi:glucokinase
MGMVRNASEGCWIGVDIGGTKTAVVVSGTPPVVLARREFATAPEKGPEPALKRIVTSIEELVAETRYDSIQAIGVSCGSPLDRKRGVIQEPPNLPGWVDVPIAAYLSDKFGAPCRLENDANAGAVAEFRYGAGQGSQTMIFITMGTGFGAGIVIEGRLFHGVTDSAGEIGHVRLTADGPVGYNKAGSVEGWASGGGIAQVAREAVAHDESQGTHSPLAKLRRIAAKDIAVAAGEGDPTAKKILLETGQKTGEALAILIDLFNPDRIVMGGIAMRLGDQILAPAREVISREALPHAAAACHIVTAQLDESIGDVAALCVAQGLDS